MRPNALASAMFLVATVAFTGGCRTTSAASKGHGPSPNAGETCGPEGMARRRTATFERSKSCAADAIGVGLAESIQTAALAAGEAKALASAINAFNAMKKSSAFNLNVAKGTLCVETLLGGYGLTELVKVTSDRLITAGLSPDAEYESLATIAANVSSGGLAEVFHLLGKTTKEPTLENVLKFGTKSANSFGEVSRVLNACISVFDNVLSQRNLNVIQLANLNKILLKVTVAAGITNCASAGLFNAIDAATEIDCLVKDLTYLQEQTRNILAAERAICQQLSNIATLPTSRPALMEIRNRVDPETGTLDEATVTRAGLCHRVITTWGHCLASTQLSMRSQGYCRKLCARLTATTRDDFMRAAATTGFPDTGELAGLVADAGDHCVSRGNPDQLVADGLKPCVNLCSQGAAGELPQDLPQFLPP